MIVGNYNEKINKKQSVYKKNLDNIKMKEEERKL